MLDTYRSEIDKIDREIVRLFEARLDICTKIGDYKRANKLPVYDKAREEEKLSSLSVGSSCSREIQCLYKAVFSISRGYQQWDSDTKISRSERAMGYFDMGYNCAQSVVLAFCDLLSLDCVTAAGISSSFGGGVARLREMCGAVSGMAFVLGALYGYSTPETGEIKAEHYKRVQQVALKFEEIKGSIVCRELLDLDCKHSTPTPTPRTKQAFGNRPCRELIGLAAEITEQYINEHK